MRTIRAITWLLAYCISVASFGATTAFSRLNYADGLSDNKVNCILKASDGFLWIGTSSGLNRYDGVRFRTWFARPNDPSALPDNSIDGLAEDASRTLWCQTQQGLSRFNPSTERFDNQPSLWLKAHGMNGQPTRVATDEKHNLWIATADGHIYYYDFNQQKAYCALTRRQQPKATLSAIAAKGSIVALTYDNGLLLRMDARTLRPVALIKQMYNATKGSIAGYNTFIDHSGNLWEYANDKLLLVRNDNKDSRFITGFMIKAVNEDKAGRILLATDHNGLVALNPNGRNVAQ